MEKKKLIEVALPLEAINAASVREKSIRHGHPSTLHLWWARRPLAACRAIIFAQLVDDPSAHPDEFPTEEDQDRERQRLFQIIEELVLWENTNNETVLERARAEIRKSCGDDLPSVYDPFCGGGSIPLEAQRLGLEAYGSDLNPVAVMISKALVEIPPKFSGQAPVNPKAQAELNKGGTWNTKGAQGLTDDVRYYGQWMRDEAEKFIGHLYPQIEVTSQATADQPSLTNLEGRKLTVIAWLWARTIASPNPAIKGTHVPLISSFMLSAKKNKKAWIEPVIDAKARKGYRIVIRSGRIAEEDEIKAKKGTKVGRGADFRCLLTEEPISPEYVKSEGMAGRFGWCIMAIVADGPSGRVYLPATEADEQLALGIKAEWKPEIPLSTHPQYMSVTKYGPKVVGDLFMERQALALNTFSNLVPKARSRVLIDASNAGLQSSDEGIEAGGDGATAYADAVVTYLALNVSRLANRQSTSSFWHTSRETVEQVFAMQALPMRWDTAEGNPFSISTGNFLGQLGYLTKVIEASPVDVLPASVWQLDAQSASFTDQVLSTDPPYYDNVPYADLSDFFYSWLRPTLQPVFPTLFNTIAVPKYEELVADHKRHGSAEAAEKFFLDGMSKVMSRAYKETNSSIPTTIYYAFRQGEKSIDGISSTGWEKFLSAIVQNNFSVVGTWPVRTELTGNLKKKRNALASSIVLVCRKRSETATITTRAEFLKALKRELPKAIQLLQHSSIAPVDMAQASIGPGMAIFSSYSKILEADDSAMEVKIALKLINQTLDEHLSEQEADYDPDTRFAITWFETNGLETGQYGEAEVLANARGVAVTGVVEAGILEARGGNVRLLRREEMLDDWDPATDQRLTIWECSQYLIRALETEGEAAAADLLHRLGSRGEAARDLAYRLYGICERKNWADEGLAYNGLVVAWPEILRLAAQGLAPGPAEPELALEPGEA